MKLNKRKDDMIKKRVLLAIFILFVGILTGILAHFVSFSCVEFRYHHTSFYGALANKMETLLAKRGYLTNCPAFFPKSTIYFINSTNDYNYILPMDSNHYFAVIGDCSQPIDLEYLKKFDALLVIDEYMNGYLSSFNLRTLYFPLEDKRSAYCGTKFETHNLDLELAVSRLDMILQGVLHEKF